MEQTRTYECMCLLDNREVRKGWEPIKQVVTGMFNKHGVEVLSARRWDERRLAFPIKGQERGTYLLTYVKGNATQLNGVRRDLQFSDSVLRNLMLVCDAVPEEAYEPEAEFDVNTIPFDDEPEAASAEAEGGAEAGGEAEAGEAAAEDGDAAEASAEASDAAESTDEAAEAPAEAADSETAEAAAPAEESQDKEEDK